MHGGNDAGRLRPPPAPAATAHRSVPATTATRVRASAVKSLTLPSEKDTSTPSGEEVGTEMGGCVWCGWGQGGGEGQRSGREAEVRGAETVGATRSSTGGGSKQPLEASLPAPCRAKQHAGATR